MTTKLLSAFLVIALSGLFLFSSTGKVYACSCIAPSDPKTSLEESDAVFRGTVTKVEDGEDINQNKSVVFDVKEIWKGENIVKLESVQTGGNSAACGYEFVEGSEYVVYASEFENEYNVSLCSRTALVSDASTDIQELGEGQVPETVTTPDATNEEPTTSDPVDNTNNEMLFYSFLGGGVTLGIIALLTLAYYLMSGKKKNNTMPTPTTEPTAIAN